LGITVNAQPVIIDSAGEAGGAELFRVGSGIQLTFIQDFLGCPIKLYIVRMTWDGLLITKLMSVTALNGFG
jgi:hypothetical protein